MYSTGSDDQNIILTDLILPVTADRTVGIFRWHDDFERGMPVRWIVFSFVIVVKTDLSIRAIGNCFVYAG